MTNRPQLERLMMRCGRIPPPDPSSLVDDGDAFMFAGLKRTFRTMPTLDAGTCAGYACELPEVMDVVCAYPQWKVGTLADFLGERPARPLLTCLSALESGKNQLEFDRAERFRAESERKRAQHGR